MPEGGPFFVRTASRADIPAVHHLLVATWHHTYNAILGAERVSEITGTWHAPEKLEARLGQPRSEFIVADDGTVVGGMAFAALAADDKTVSLHQLYVLPDFQGAGIGSSLLEEMEHSFPQAERIHLEVEPANGAAIAFYEAKGYCKVGQTEDCGGMQSGIPALIYEKRLLLGN